MVSELSLTQNINVIDYLIHKDYITLEEYPTRKLRSSQEHFEGNTICATQQNDAC